MKVLVIGSGGREHAIAWKLRQSKRISKLYCAPGNAGIAEIAECVDLKADDIEGLLQFALTNKIDITIVGPEIPLNMGIADVFKHNNLKIFGPNKNAALLESSKAFSKAFMKKYNIPTARYSIYDSYESALSEIDSYGFPVVIKADGLAAGKGVIIADNKDGAITAIRDIMIGSKFGMAGSRVVIEEFLEGREATILTFVDGKTAVPMVSSQDYKRAMDNDEGLNTGGMGAVSPAFYYDEGTAAIVKETIIDRTMEAMKKEGIDYKGVLYLGLMLTSRGPMVIEYNARFGDPETEVVLPRLKTDLLDIVEAILEERLSEISVEWKQEAAVCVVLTSGGYPEGYKTGYEITGLDYMDSEIIALHAGTKSFDGKVLTAGGRVMAITAFGDTVEAARANAYGNIEKIKFKDSFYRKDIALK